MDISKKVFEVMKPEDRIKEKKSMLGSELVKSKLQSKELRVAELSTNAVIKTIPEEVLMQRIVMMAKGIARDFGIKNIEGDDFKRDAFRFFTIVKNYYSNLTLQELNASFELALVGELDEYLPKREGVADKSHFQSFSVEFTTRILKAFLAYKGRVWQKVYNGIAKEEIEPTTEEKRLYREQFIEAVRDLYNSYCEGKEIDLVFPDYIANYLITEGKIKDRSLEERDFKKGLVNYLQGGANQYDKAKVREAFNKAEILPELEVEARRVKNKELILKGFEEIKTKGLEL
jgi:hypothetical protein